MSPGDHHRDGRVVSVTGSPAGRTPNTVLDVVLGVTAFGNSIRTR
jgi:hypothetical protein